MPIKLPIIAVFAAVCLLAVTGCDDSRSCNQCNGTGRVNIVDSWTGRQVTMACPQCNGSGEIHGKDSGSSPGGPFGGVFRILKSLGVPSGFAVVVVIALVIYMDYRHNRSSDEERRKKD